MNKETYKLYADCIPVKGYFRSVIMDLTRKKYLFIPNNLCDILQQKVLINKRNLDVSYFGLLVDNEIIFKCAFSESLLYPPLNTTWEVPNLISNAILEIGNNLDHILKAIQELLMLGCRHFLWIYKKKMSNEELEILLNSTKTSIALTIEVYVPYDENTDIELLWETLNKHNRISYVLFYKSSHTQILSQSGVRGNIVFYNKDIDYAKSNIHWGNINVNMPLYTESLHYNTFFNRKVCINEEGDVFNYFTQNESFGNIHTEKLEKIIKKRNFQKLWTITKDTILTCSVCEFRYMCVDSRIPVQIKDGHWQHLTSCTYNPYICKWQGEEGYVPVEECGTYSRETGFVPDKKKIAKLNKEIWGE